MTNTTSTPKNLTVQRLSYTLRMDRLTYRHVTVTIKTPQQSNYLTVDIPIPSNKLIGNSLLKSHIDPIQ